jgi:hypothetical protein
MHPVYQAPPKRLRQCSDRCQVSPIELFGPFGLIAAIAEIQPWGRGLWQGHRHAQSAVPGIRGERRLARVGSHCAGSPGVDAAALSQRRCPALGAKAPPVLPAACRRAPESEWTSRDASAVSTGPRRSAPRNSNPTTQHPPPGLQRHAVRGSNPFGGAY